MREHEVELVVVGLPLSLDGGVGPAARRAIDETSQIGNVVGVPVETYDERFTTVSAERSLLEGVVRGEDRRRVVDKVAAAIMLQALLDSRRGERRRMSIASTTSRREVDVADPEVIDWRPDPWDDPEVIGVVEPIRRQTRLSSGWRTSPCA